MSLSHQVIARRLAVRFAPELGARLPSLVDEVLDDERAEETPLRGIDPNVLIAFASFTVSVALAVHTIISDLQNKSRARQREEELAGVVKDLQEELAFLKGMALADLRAKVPSIPQVSGAVRERLLEAAVDEALGDVDARRGA